LQTFPDHAAEQKDESEIAFNPGRVRSIARRLRPRVATMIRKVVLVIVLAPLAAMLIAFAVANRHAITVSFDPFAGGGYALSVPLYLIVFASLIGGVVVGGFAAWIEQGKWRRARARLAAEMRTVRAELDVHRRRAEAHEAVLRGGVRVLPGRDARPPTAA
jgi:uncharacterized integral membrane protein